MSPFSPLSYLSALLLCVYCLSILPSVHTLSVVNSTYEFYSFEADTTQFELVAFDVQFDAPVTLWSHLQSFNLSEIDKQFAQFCLTSARVGDCMSYSSFLSFGLVSMTCTDSSVFSTSLESFPPAGTFTGPPNFLLLGVGNNEPVNQFLFPFGGIRVPAEIYQNRVTIVFIMSWRDTADGSSGSQFTRQSLRQCQPKLNFPGNATLWNGGNFMVTDSYLFNNVTGSVSRFNGTITPTYKPLPSCSNQRYSRFMRSMDGFLKTSLSSSTESTDQVMILRTKLTSKSLSASSDYQSCYQYFKGMVTIGNQTVPLTNTTACLEKTGTFAFATDPCCNRTLAVTQCCAPRDRNITVTVPLTVSSTINSTCANPGAAKALLFELANYDISNSNNAGNSIGSSASNPLDQDYLDFSQVINVWNNYLLPASTCWNKVQTPQTCFTNNDCSSGSICNNFQSMPGTCSIAHKDLTPAVARCLLKDLKPQVIFQIIQLFNIRVNVSFTSTNIEAYVPAFAQLIRDNASNYTCTGPADSALYQKRVNGQTVIPADQSGCLQAQGCNYQPFLSGAITNQQACLAPTTSSFCGIQCETGQCIDISRPASCIISLVFDEAGCTNLGGSWVSLGDAMGFWCIRSNITSAANCLSDQKLCKTPSWDSNTPYCANPTCYFPTLTQQQCADRQANATAGAETYAFVTYSPNRVDAVCQYTTTTAPISRSACDAVGGTWWEGRYWRKATYANQATCEAGTCSASINFNVISNGMDAATCASKSTCSKNCQNTCRSLNAVDFGVPNIGPRFTTLCYSTQAAAVQNCTLNGGLLQSNAQQEMFCAFTITDRFQCLQSGYQWASCRQFDGNATACTGNVFNTYLQCSYFPEFECEENECAGRGSCNDDVLTVWPGSSLDGVCITPYKVDAWGIPIMTCETYGFEVSPLSLVTPSGCKTPFNQTFCVSSGGRFLTRSTTRDSCEAKDSTCIERSSDGHVFASSKSVSACTSCQDKVQPLYQWQAARLQTATMRANTKWMNRAWGSLNTWAMQYDADMFIDRVLSQAVKGLIRKQTNTTMASTVFPPFRLVERLACLCANDNAAVCATAPILTPLVDTAISVSSAGQYGPLDLQTQPFNQSSAQNVSFIQLTVASSAASNYLTPNSTIDSQIVIPEPNTTDSANLVANVPSFRISKVNPVTPFQRLAAINDYSIIRNSHGVIIGQVLGKGMDLDFGVSVKNADGSSVIFTGYQWSLCLPISPDIPRSTVFSEVKIFAKIPKAEAMYGKNVYTELYPGDRTFDGKTLCSSFTSWFEGTFFPAALLPVTEGETPNPITIELVSDKVGQLVVYWTHNSQDLAPSSLSITLVRDDPTRNFPTMVWNSPVNLGSTQTGSHIFYSLQPADNYMVRAKVFNQIGSRSSRQVNVTIASIALPQNAASHLTLSLYVYIFIGIVTVAIMAM